MKQSIHFIILLCLFLSTASVAQIDSVLLRQGAQLYKEALELVTARAHEKSILKAKEAMQIFEQLGQWEDYVIAIGVLARNQVQVGDFAEVEKLNESAKVLIESKELNPDLYLQIYFLSGTTQYERGWYKESLDDFEATAKILEEDRELIILGEDKMPVDLIAIQRNTMLGHTYNYAAFSIQAMGDFDRAIAYFKKAKRHYEAANSLSDVLGTSSNIGIVHLIKAAPKEAIVWFQQIIDVLEPIQKGIPILATAYKNMSVVYSQLKNFEKENYYFEKALALFEHPEIGTLESFTGTPTSVALLHLKSNIALNKLQRGLKESALKEAGQLFLEADSLKRDEKFIASSLNYIGEIYLQTENFDEALACFQKGLHRLAPTISPTIYTQNPDSEGVANKFVAIALMSNKGKAMVANAKEMTGSERTTTLQTVLQTVDAGVKILDDIQRYLVKAANDQTSRESSLVEIQKSFQDLFDAGMLAAYKLYTETKEAQYLEKAFFISEKSKAFILQQALNRGVLRSDFPTEHQVAIQKLEDEIFSLQKRIATAKKGNQTSKQQLLEERLFEKKKAYESFIKTLTNSPTTARYFNDQYQPRIATIEEAKSFLKMRKGTVMVDIYEAEKDLIVTFIDEQKNKLYKVSKPENWNDLILAINKFHLDEDLIVNKIKMDEYIRINHLVYNRLFNFGAELLEKDRGKIENLIIIPNHATHQLNFNLLLKSPDLPVFHQLDYPAVADCSTLDYLVHQYAISYAPSISTLIREVKIREQISQTDEIEKYDFGLIGFAPDYVYRNKKQKKNRGLPYAHLPDEVSSLVPFFGAGQVKLVKNGQATEANFRKMVAAYSANIIHISAHGIINDTNPFQSKLVLDTSIESEKVGDDNLEVGELYNIKMNTQLAILSACDSGSGELIGGEGKINIARGFAYANCPNIIMSLWKLEATASKEVVDSLYENLINKHQFIDVALQQAQLGYLQSKKSEFEKSKSSLSKTEQSNLLFAIHPKYWAGFVPIGIIDQLNLK